MAITAKVSLSSKVETANGVALSFYADYRDGANEEWRHTTPTLNLTMTVRKDVADNFPLGSYTLTFDPEVSDG